MTNTTALDLDRLEALAKAATPQNFDSAQITNQGCIECPTCDGSGEVELTADYCNYDGRALGVQFYGIGPEHRAAEAFYRAANPAAILQLIADLRAALAAKGQQEPVAWMNPDELVASDAFRWTQISRAPEYSVPVYRAAPVAQQSEALDADELTRLRRLMNALGHTDAFERDDDYVRGILCTVLGQAASKIERQSEAGAPTAAALPENWQNDVQTAWRCVRKYNNTIPDATLDLMRDMLLAAPTSGRESAAPAATNAPPAELWSFEVQQDAPYQDHWIAFINRQGPTGKNVRNIVRYVPEPVSAAPAAPVREVDREQDANLATARDAVRRVMADLSVLHEDKPEEMAATIALTATLVSGDLELAANSIDAAMQKGAQQ